ncbi:hypothetical protein PI124_g24111, partial [Phytophthora idaei]
MTDNYTEVTTPKATTAFDEANKAAARLIKPKAILRRYLGLAYRASSLCIGMNWLCNLIVGVAYPYISDALDDYA